MMRHVRFAVGLGCMAMAGCGGGDGLPRKAIAGTVTLDGRPLDGGRIEFRPIGEGIPAGSTIEGGSYRIAGAEGPTPGRYRVNISAAGEIKPIGAPGPEPDGSGPGRDRPSAIERVPARYNASSILSAEVKDGVNTFDFALDSTKNLLPKDQKR